MKDSRSKGFTLIEIVIALAIMSIVMVAASRFMMSVLTQYSKDNYDIKLQTEVEEILNLVENKVMGADGAQVTSDGELQIYFSNDSENYLFYLNDTDYYYAKNGEKSLRVYLGTHVSSVDYKVTESTVTVNLHMAYRGSTYDASRSILLRNSETAGSASSLLDQIGAYINSAKSVTVNADGSMSVIDETGTQKIIRLDQTAGSVKCGNSVLGTDVSKLTFSKDEDQNRIHVVVENKDGQTLERYYEIGTSTGETEESGENVGGGTDFTEESGTEETTAVEDNSGVSEILTSQDDASNTTPSDSSSENGDSNTTPSQDAIDQGASGQDTSSSGSNDQNTSEQDYPATPNVVSLGVQSNDSYVDGKNYCVKITVKNNGSDVLWQDVKLRYYFIGPEDETVVLSYLDYSLTQLGCQSEIATLSTPCEGATQYIDLTFPSSNAVFKAGEEQDIVFGLRYNSWQNIVDNGTDYEMANSYSRKNTNAVPVYYKNELVAGEAPTTPLKKGEFAPQITDLSYSFNESGNQCTVTVKMKNNGSTISWNDIALRFYYNKSGREQVNLENTSYSGKKGSGGLSYTSETIPGATYKNATDYLTVKANNGGWFLQNEEVTLKFTVKYQSGRTMKTDLDNSFANSHFLLGKDYISVYQGTTKKCGEDPDALAENTLTLETCNPVVVARNDSYSDDQKSYKISFDLQNQGQTLDLSKLEVRFYYIKPGKRTITLSSNSAKIIDCNSGVSTSVSSKNLDSSYDDAEYYISFKPDSGAGKLYSYETYQAGVTLCYDGGVLMSGGSAKNKFDNSFSRQSGNTYLAVYYDGVLVSGSVPTAQSSLKDCEPVITVNEKLSTSTNTQADIHLEMQNTGKNLDFSKLEIRYYYTTPGRESLQLNNFNISIDDQQIYNYSVYDGDYALNQMAKSMSGATNYISFKMKDYATFYTYETLSISCSATYESGREMFSSQYSKGFQNSYSLGTGTDHVVIYYDGKCVFGQEPNTAETALDTAAELSNFSAVLSEDKKSYHVQFELINKGQDLDITKLQMLFYYIKPTKKTLVVGNLKYTFYGSTYDTGSWNGWKPTSSNSTTDTKFVDATNYLTISFGASDKLYQDERITVEFDLSYSDGAELTSDSDQYAFVNSHSLKQGSYVVVKYGNAYTLGYEPSIEMEDDGQQAVMPKNLSVTFENYWTNCNWWTSGYGYKYNIMCDNYDEIDWSLFKVNVYVYFENLSDSGALQCSGSFAYNTVDGAYSVCDKGSSNYKAVFTNLKANSNWSQYWYYGGLEVYISRYVNGYMPEEADLSKCYTKDAATIEVYYNGVLVWPAS